MRVILFSITLMLGTTLSLAVAQAEQAIQVPPQERELSSILSKYNDLDASAPNEIQRDKVDAQFRPAFCAAIPRGTLTDWIGEVDTIDDDTPDKSVRLSLLVSTADLYSGALGVELVLGNYEGYGIVADVMPHEATTVALGSPLYDAVSNLRSGDTLRFSATVVPYSSEAACIGNNTSYFALVRFTGIQRIGWGFELH